MAGLAKDSELASTTILSHILKGMSALVLSSEFTNVSATMKEDSELVVISELSHVFERMPELLLASKKSHVSATMGELPIIPEIAAWGPQ